MIARKLQSPAQYQGDNSEVAALKRRIAELERIVDNSSQARTNSRLRFNRQGFIKSDVYSMFNE